MKKFYLSCILTSLFLGITSYRYESCCRHGIQAGDELLRSDRLNCSNFNEKVLANFTSSKEITLCKEIHRQCCVSTGKSNVCEQGIHLASANKLCLKGPIPEVGIARSRCCDCCKTGEKDGKQRKDCEQKVGDELCQHAYKKCCANIKSKLPKVPTPLIKNCKEILCDSLSTLGCEDRPTGAVCICKYGFRSMDDRITCADRNECAEGIAKCGTRKCINTYGTYTCECQAGYKYNKDLTVCVKQPKLDTNGCKEGYTFKDGKCEDINECKSDMKTVCGQNMYCLNVPGSYTCRETCPDGEFKREAWNGRVICEDVDECATGIHNCSDVVNLKCVNLIGGFNCKITRCRNGYKMVGRYCEDIDECKENPILCGLHGHCRNTRGTFSCDCDFGYYHDRETNVCKDKDECAMKLHNCAHKCVNQIGTYTCICPAGYELRGRGLKPNSCFDMDECKKTNICPANTRCFNTFGSYECINETCPNEFYVRTSQKNQPDSCRKDCNPGWLELRKRKCHRIITASIKRAAFKFQKVLLEHDFLFKYWLHFQTSYYTVKEQIIKGNESEEFELKRISEGEINLTNGRSIEGPRKFHLIMQTDVYRKSNGKLLWRYIYHVHIFISRYGLIG